MKLNFNYLNQFEVGFCYLQSIITLKIYLSQDLSDEGEEANTNIQELARQREQKS